MKSNLIKISLLSTLLLCFVLVSLFLGSENISISSVFGKTINETHRFIFLEIRLPRVITSLIAGVGLSISGLLMQTYFRNSLAGPSILGTTSGASFGVAMVVMSSSILGLETSSYSYSITLASVFGAAGILFIILIIASKIGNGVILLITGIIISSFLGATVTILQYFTDAQNIQKYILWTMGSTTSTTLNDVYIMLICCISGVLLMLFLIKPLNALLMGEEYAKSMGVNTVRAKYLIIFSTGILTGSITAFCGPIAFIGLAVPHLVKLKVKQANHNVLLPLTAITGGLIMVLSDILSQNVLLEFQLPINAVTSIISAPIIMYVILKQRNFHG